MEGERASGKARLSAQIPGDLYQALERRASRKGRTVKELAERLLEEHLLGQRHQE